MPIKVSEKKLLLGVICFAAGIFLLIQTTLITTPIRVSEKGLFICAAALCLLVLAVRLFKRAVLKG